MSSVPAPSWPALEEAPITEWFVALVREHADRLQADARVAVVPCPVVRLDERKETK